MANFSAVTIPLCNISKISIVVTDCKKSLAEVQSSTSADYVLNGTLYNLKTGDVNLPLKSGGTVVKDTGYHILGYAWGLGADIAMMLVPCDRANYISCTPLVRDGQPIPSLQYADGQGGCRGRSAIGIKADRLALYCTKDGSASSRTPEQLRDDLAAAGWSSAIMLDGGTSSQCYFNGQVVQSLDAKGNARKVQHWICVWLKSSSAGKRTTGAAGLTLIKQFEGCRLKAYKPFAYEKFWTIGWGHYGADVAEGQTITQAQADALLVTDLKKYEKYVLDAAYCPITAKLTQNQFDALVSFTYNCGSGCLKTLCKGRTAAQIAEKLPLYNRSGGKAVAGLTRRRLAEQALFNK